MTRVVWFWNRFALKEGEQPVKLDWPWKEGEEPEWYHTLTQPPETIVDPVMQLDPERIGAKRFLKAIRRQKIKQFNQAIKSKDFSVIKQNIKQLPP